MKSTNFEEWIDIEGLEVFREYIYPDGSTYRVDTPVSLFVKESGSHKLVDASGMNHYVKSGWVAFRFEGDWCYNVTSADGKDDHTKDSFRLYEPPQQGGKWDFTLKRCPIQFNVNDLVPLGNIVIITEA